MQSRESRRILSPRFTPPQFSIDDFRSQPDVVKKAIDAAIVYYGEIERQRDQLEEELYTRQIDIQKLNEKAKIKAIIDFVQGLCSIAGGVFVGLGENIIATCMLTSCTRDYNGVVFLCVGIMFLGVAVLSPLLQGLLEKSGAKT